MLWQSRPSSTAVYGDFDQRMRRLEKQIDRLGDVASRTPSNVSRGVGDFSDAVFAAVNDKPPSVTLAIPDDFVRTLMDSIGLGAREFGLNAIIQRLKRYASDAAQSAARS